MHFHVFYFRKDRSAVHRILKDRLYHPYKVRVQQLEPGDCDRRLEFSRLGEVARDPTFVKYILWTDESLFTREGCFNAHNLHVWSVENPLALREREAQHRWSVNFWAGNVDKQILGPCILPDKLDGPRFRVFLEHTLPNLMDDVPLAIRQNMFFQMDAAPAHHAVSVRTHIDQTFEDRWFGCGGPVAWPARSPDLNPLDFFLWGYLKNEVYRKPVRSAEEMLARVRGTIAAISTATLKRMQREVVRRAELCVQENGGHIEHLL
ncbi:uncharacterized protein LOC143209337 [Lasioglossum baleicum]|uniref:uncharacterized protein LOC143209337 n=1 Tax=Lasioglossum baleicum TaxID=434251 RepID=UPI003FCDE527